MPWPFPSCAPRLAPLLAMKKRILNATSAARRNFSRAAPNLRLLPGPGAQIDETALRQALAHNDPSFVHETPLETLSLTNLTECGTAYSVESVEHYVTLAKAEGLNVHLDGARLANALVSTHATPAEMSWKAGVDVLTFGLTKTGAIGCEIILLFGDMRFQFEALKARAKSDPATCRQKCASWPRKAKPC